MFGKDATDFTEAETHTVHNPDLSMFFCEHEF